MTIAFPELSYECATVHGNINTMQLSPDMKTCAADTSEVCKFSSLHKLRHNFNEKTKSPAPRKELRYMKYTDPLWPGPLTITA